MADFVLQNPKKVLFMSITDLAEACDVGDTSVFRFCKTMELKGYQEFKMMLSLDLGDGGKKHSQLTGDVELDDTPIFQPYRRHTPFWTARPLRTLSIFWTGPGRYISLVSAPADWRR